MKNKGLLITAIIFFLTVNTTYYWEGKLRLFAFPAFLILVIIFSGLGVALNHSTLLRLRQVDKTFSLVRVTLTSLLIFFLHFHSGAQNTKWMAQFHRTILDSMNVKFTKPSFFLELEGVECFKSFPRLRTIIGCAGNQLITRDGEILAFLYVYPIFTIADSIRMQKIFPDKSFDVIDKIHTNTIQNGIKISEGGEAARDWKKYVNYYSGKETKFKFNADTAIKFSIHLKQEDFYKNKYQFLSALFIQKKDRGLLGIYVFYTPDAKGKMEDYWADIETIFKYKD